MNILFLSRWYPFPADNGSKIRIFNVLKQLAVQHEITLLSFRGSQEAVTDNSRSVLGDVCAEVRLLPYRPFCPTSARSLLGLFSPQPRFLVDTYSPEMSVEVKSAVRARDYDLVIASQLEMIPYALALKECPRFLEELEVGAFLDAAKRATPAVQRMRAILTWHKLRSYLSRMLPRFVACTVVSDPERAIVQRIAPAKTRVQTIVNAVDTSTYRGSFGTPADGTLLFSGALTYSANFDALRYFLNDIYPLVRQTLPSASVSVIGNTTGVDLDTLPRQPGVHYTGYLPDIRPIVAQSWVTVVPLRVGGGTRLKILESMALGTPVVSTSKGAEGLAVTHGENIILADDPVSFARRVVEVLRSADLRRRISTNGRHLVESRYDWGIVGQDLRSLVDQVVA